MARPLRLSNSYQMAANKGEAEKYGFFGEPSYTTIGDPYKPPFVIALCCFFSSADFCSQPIQMCRNPKAGFNASASKGKQMMTTIPKKPSALPDGNFDKTFKRLLEGEAYYDPVKERRRAVQESKKLNKAGPFVPSNGPKSLGGKGGNFNTFSGKIEAFSPAEKPRDPPKKEGKNFLVNPPKKGGPGFVGTTLGPLAPYASEEYSAAHALELKEKEAHRKLVKGGPFRVATMQMSLPFDPNPFGSDKGRLGYLTA